MRSKVPGRSLHMLVSEEPTEAEIEGALSARYTPEFRERQHAQALSANFDPLPVPEPIVRGPTPLPPEPPSIPQIRIDYPVVAITRADFPGWGPWLIDELCAAWPHFLAVNQYSVMQTWMGSNDHHFVRTSNSAALAISVPHPLLGGATVVRGIFCWSRFHQEEGAELHLVQLHRHCIEWSRARKALRFECFEKNDLVGGRVDFFCRPAKRTMRYVETR